MLLRYVDDDHGNDPDQSELAAVTDRFLAAAKKCGVSLEDLLSG